MNQPPNSKQNVSSDKAKIILVIIFLAILLLAFGILVGLVLRSSGFQLPATAIPPTSVAPTVFVPTVDCGVPTFVLDSTTFQLQTLRLAPDGSLTVPPDSSDIVYWVEGTEGNYAFVLSPTSENIAIETTLAEGSTARVTWADCSSMIFGLAAPEPGPANASTLLDQLTSGITIFFQTDSAGNGIIVKGELAERTFP